MKPIKQILNLEDMEILNKYGVRDSIFDGNDDHQWLQNKITEIIDNKWERLNKARKEFAMDELELKRIYRKTLQKEESDEKNS